MCNLEYQSVIANHVCFIVRKTNLICPFLCQPPEMFMFHHFTWNNLKSASIKTLTYIEAQMRCHLKNISKHETRCLHFSWCLKTVGEKQQAEECKSFPVKIKCTESNAEWMQITTLMMCICKQKLRTSSLNFTQFFELISLNYAYNSSERFYFVFLNFLLKFTPFLSIHTMKQVAVQYFRKSRAHIAVQFLPRLILKDFYPNGFTQKQMSPVLRSLT